MITVHNKKLEAMQPRDLYIGRGSVWGNPFVMRHEGERADVIERYREYIIDRLYREPALRRALDELKALHTEGDLKLFCFCAPLPCHGDILRGLITGW